MESNHEFVSGLPDPAAASRFLDELAERHPAEHAKLSKKPGLLSDVLTLASFSPLLATTLLQNPDHIWWLDRKRRLSGVRSTEDLLESLARFSLVNSQLAPQVLFARFRRRELMRIFLRDIRRLAGIAEITEEISNLADTILASALKLARNEMDNRFGTPQQTDADGRLLPSTVCIAALGKLGSRELNYSSDIDLLFIYSAEGQTAGGDRGSVTNREYFVKLVEYIVKLVGSNKGEGAAYRVDLRLRPHGRLGALALTVDDMVGYYRTDARPWERQVMIRSRPSAGDTALFKTVFSQIEELVFDKRESVESALESVRLSKEQIDREAGGARGFNVKLGRGGIREIEFIAQALQLAHGGRDRWLRVGHTLISLMRLADRGHVSEAELTELSSAYEFLRRTEHMLQMENGLQTHTVPDDLERRAFLAARISFAGSGDLESDLTQHTENVRTIFLRVFGSEAPIGTGSGSDRIPGAVKNPVATAPGSDVELAPRLAALLATRDASAADIQPENYSTELISAVEGEKTMRRRLAALRQNWSRLLSQIAVADVAQSITLHEAKHLQTALAESAIEAAMRIAAVELSARYGGKTDGLDLAVLALGKLGGGGVDHDSDLDLLFVYDDASKCPTRELTHAEFYARTVEIFVTALSSVTRDGSLYRVDLRLRPYGGKGLTANPATNFLEYMRETADVWELLAFVKLRAVGGDMQLAQRIEHETRRIIHARALEVDPAELAAETRRVRLALEKQRSRTRRKGEVDIKYGAGGMLDVYFAMRYLQLRDNVPDDGDNRSTRAMLDRLRAGGSLTADAHTDLVGGYEFLAILDHNLRITVGRTTRLPQSKVQALARIAERMELPTTAALIENLTIHRLNIRKHFDDIVR
jgi:glutamate-ammonia-ligase adenylyltransferase